MYRSQSCLEMRCEFCSRQDFAPACPQSTSTRASSYHDIVDLNTTEIALVLRTACSLLLLVVVDTTEDALHPSGETRQLLHHQHVFIIIYLLHLTI